MPPKKAKVSRSIRLRRSTAHARRQAAAKVALNNSGCTLSSEDPLREEKSCISNSHARWLNDSDASGFITPPPRSENPLSIRQRMPVFSEISGQVINIQIKPYQDIWAESPQIKKLRKHDKYRPPKPVSDRPRPTKENESSAQSSFQPSDGWSPCKRTRCAICANGDQNFEDGLSDDKCRRLPQWNSVLQVGEKPPGASH